MQVLHEDFEKYFKIKKLMEITKRKQLSWKREKTPLVKIAQLNASNKMWQDLLDKTLSRIRSRYNLEFAAQRNGINGNLQTVGGFINALDNFSGIKDSESISKGEKQPEKKRRRRISEKTVR